MGKGSWQVGSQLPGRDGLWECLDIKPHGSWQVTEKGKPDHWRSSATASSLKEPTPQYL